ncbi:hypothetical protein BDW42DRAFT_170072 [Aspergillus taichungensis]|uniref:Uncharacterized protein n=1 Tax=Aspergillus taichungensis TaxID=482145 RepID=A0A2J5HUA0_9EURO|nr:hypothetical protein BDW42DRAFT_170072 [Aspergillus taichungensis]
MRPVCFYDCSALSLCVSLSESFPRDPVLKRHVLSIGYSFIPFFLFLFFLTFPSPSCFSPLMIATPWAMMKLADQKRRRGRGGIGAPWRGDGRLISSATGQDGVIGRGGVFGGRGVRLRIGGLLFVPCSFLLFLFPVILCFLITSRERQASREYVCSCLLRRYRTKRPQFMNLAISNPFHTDGLFFSVYDASYGFFFSSFFFFVFFFSHNFFYHFVLYFFLYLFSSD